MTRKSAGFALQLPSHRFEQFDSLATAPHHFFTCYNPFLPVAQLSDASKLHQKSGAMVTSSHASQAHSLCLTH